MDDIHVSQALSDATSALQRHHDVIGFLVDVIAVCQTALDVDATGIMVLSRRGRLQLLAASTHGSTELELYQSQIDEGPCVDAAADNTSVIVADETTLRQRWPQFGPAMLEAGFRSVHSAPLRWDGAPMGAMALFRHDPIPFDRREDRAAQAFAEIVAHAVMDDGPARASDGQARINAALVGRIVVEQAKGVLARHRKISVAEAYDVLVAQAHASGSTVTAVAEQLVLKAQRGALGRHDPGL